MKTLFSVCLLLLPLVASATIPTTTPQNPSPFSTSEDTKSILITTQHGVAVYGSTFLVDGKTYVRLQFENTTNEDVRILWSAELGGTDVILNVDGTIQAYLTIPSGESVSFGEVNSNDALLENPEGNLEEAITIRIEIK